MEQVIALEPLFERLPAREKRFRETIVFVHHYGGNKYSFRRTIDWLNELGFDCVTFNLPMRSIGGMRRLPINKEWRFGLRHVWADRIEQVLGHVPENKIVFSYSMPSNAALMAIARRHAIDIKGWVCDGGPFKGLTEGILNLIEEGEWVKTDSALLRTRARRLRVASFFAWLSAGFKFDQEMRQNLQMLPKGFPILSVRSVRDALVSPQSIAGFFDGAEDRLQLEVLSLEKAGHLAGFKEEPDSYQNRVQLFLTSIATKL